MSTSSRILQLDVMGSFDFFTSIISIDAIASTEFHQLPNILGKGGGERRLTLEQYQATERIMPLIAHEQTHFIDATSTCWGQRHLRTLDLAFRSNLAQQEADFFHLKSAHTHMRTIRLPAYYTLVADFDRQIGPPWTHQVTIGRRYTSEGKLEGSKPIAFCKFGIPAGQFLARSPLSLVSLLETSATAQELQQRWAYLKLVDGVEGTLEQRIQSRKTLNDLYNHRITEYSACAHLIANSQQCSDVLLAYRFAGILSRIVLNFAQASFDVVAQGNDALADIFEIAADHKYLDQVREGLAGYDHGILFYVLCEAMPKGSYETLETIEQGIEATLSRFGLTLLKVREDASREIESLNAEIASSPSYVLRQLSVAGARNYENISLTEPTLPFHVLHLPKVMFQDMAKSQIYANPANLLAELDPDTCFDEMFPLERAIHSFAEACV